MDLSDPLAGLHRATEEMQNLTVLMTVMSQRLEQLQRDMEAFERDLAKVTEALEAAGR